MPEESTTCCSFFFWILVLPATKNDVVVLSEPLPPPPPVGEPPSLIFPSICREVRAGTLGFPKNSPEPVFSFLFHSVDAPRVHCPLFLRPVISFPLLIIIRCVFFFQPRRAISPLPPLPPTAGGVLPPPPAMSPAPPPLLLWTSASIFFRRDSLSPPSHTNRLVPLFSFSDPFGSFALGLQPHHGALSRKASALFFSSLFPPIGY